MKSFFQNLKLFIQNVAADSRIPKYDKKVVLILMVLIVSPLDFIPDWIPLMGLLDDYVMLALILDYFFETLDSSIVLSHYPWSMKSFNRLQRIAHFFAFFAPNFIKNNLWKYQREPY